MRRGRGFTLLEVLVALAILSFAVVTMIQLFAQGLRLLRVSGDYQQAVLLADQKAREVETVREGIESGMRGQQQNLVGMKEQLDPALLKERMRLTLQEEEGRKRIADGMAVERQALRFAEAIVSLYDVRKK